MDHRKNKSSGSRAASKKGRPLGLVIALAAAGGVIVGSAGTYVLLKPLPTAKESAASAPLISGAATTTQAQPVTMSPQTQLTPQPPGEVPPGKVWSSEHGHWHDLPVAGTTPAPVPAAPVITPAPAPLTVTPSPTTAPSTPPAEKKE